jgi:hypothetical protein
LHVFTTAELQIRDRTTVHTGGGQTSDVEARAAAKCMRLEQALASAMERAGNLERALASTQYSLQTTMQERVQAAALCSDWEVACRDALGANATKKLAPASIKDLFELKVDAWEKRLKAHKMKMHTLKQFKERHQQSKPGDLMMATLEPV